ncbi:MAG: hypothetical protein AAFV95_02785 [Bacteroidota bacterium]
MKTAKTTIYALLGLAILLTTTSTETPDIIYWDGDRRLSWSDFEGEPRYDYESISALTSSGIVHYKGCQDGKIIYKVRAYFEKKESWVKEEARTLHHLTHEQLHFDITELYARKLRKALADRDFQCGQEQEFEEFVAHFLENWQYDQRSFDIHTRHSLDILRQKEWFYKIGMELSLFKEYREKNKE